MNSDLVEMRPQEIQNFLKQLWAVISDPRNDPLVKWIKGGRVFRVVDAEKFYIDLCPSFCAGCNKEYFGYFLSCCGFESIPPRGTDFFHEDFQEGDYKRTEKVRPKELVYTPKAYYSYLLETPNHEVPFVEDEKLPYIAGNVEVTAGGTLIKRELSKELPETQIPSHVDSVTPASGQDDNATINALDTLCSKTDICESLGLDLRSSDEHSSDSSSSTLVFDSNPPTPPDSAVSCSTTTSTASPESMQKTGGEKDFDINLTLSLAQCKLKELSPDSAVAAESSPGNSDSTCCGSAVNSTTWPTTDTLSSVKSRKSSLSLDIVSCNLEEEPSDPIVDSVLCPQTSTPYELPEASNFKKTAKVSFTLDL